MPSALKESCLLDEQKDCIDPGEPKETDAWFKREKWLNEENVHVWGGEIAQEEKHLPCI